MKENIKETIEQIMKDDNIIIGETYEYQAFDE